MVDDRSGLFVRRNHSVETIATGYVSFHFGRLTAPCRTSVNSGDRHSLSATSAHDNIRVSRITLNPISLGCSDAADLIAFTGNDDGLFAIGALQAQDSAILNAAPSDCDNDGEHTQPEDYGQQSRFRTRHWSSLVVRTQKRPSPAKSFRTVRIK